MKLHILNDLHIELEDFAPPATDADVVILAGDIGVGVEGLRWAEDRFPDRRVIYVPGNHDEVFRSHAGVVFGNVEIARRWIHETADGKRLLVLHGDEFDGFVQCSPLLARLGARAYEFLIWLNRSVNALRHRMGYRYWSLAAFLKHKVKNAVKYIANFERALAVEARRRGVHGVICGHIHRAEISDIDGVTYCNDGDWVESCTALVEDATGELSIVEWGREREVALRSSA